MPGCKGPGENGFVGRLVNLVMCLSVYHKMIKLIDTHERMHKPEVRSYSPAVVQSCILHFQVLFPLVVK
jgi:hypothetical protein